MSVPFALPSAITYGVADFTGGLAARRASVLVVTAVAQAAGLVSLLVVIDSAPDDSGLWPLLAGRLASVTLLTVLVLRHHLPLPARSRAASLVPVPGESGVPARVQGRSGTRPPVLLMVVSGVFDTLAN